MAYLASISCAGCGVVPSHCAPLPRRLVERGPPRIRNARIEMIGLLRRQLKIPGWRSPKLQSPRSSREISNTGPTDSVRNPPN